MTDIIGTAVMSIPDVFISAGELAANGFIRAIEWMVQQALGGIQTLANGMSSVIDQFGGKDLRNALGWGDGQIDLAKGFKLPRANFGGAAADERLSNRFSELGRLGEETANTDYMGQFFGKVSEQAVKNAKAGLDDVKGAASGANDAVKKLAEDGMTKLSATGQAVKESLSGIGSGLWGAIRQGGDVLGNIFDMLMNKVDTLIGKLLDNVFDQALFGGGAGGGGIFGMLAGLFGFAKGGAFVGGVQAFANGGIVSKPTMFPMANGAGLMGEAGPEAIMPLRRGPDGRLGVSAANQNNLQGVHITVGVSADSNGNLLPFVESVVQANGKAAAPAIISAAVSQSNKSVPAAVARYQQQRSGSDYRV
jgi:hypothetical protein